MSDLNIFYDEWRECLLAHYEYILREGEADSKNEKSLVEVLNTTGFAESEILTLRAAILGNAESNASDQVEVEVEIVDEIEPEPTEIVPEMAEMIVVDIPADVVETEVAPDQIDQIDVVQEQITADLPPAAEEQSPLKPPKQLSLF